MYDEGNRLELELRLRLHADADDQSLRQAGYNFDKHWGCQLNIDNLTDKYYIAAAAATGLVETAPTRQIEGTVKYSW